MPRPIHPDPIRSTPQAPGCGPNHSYRHLHHQRGTIGTFHVRLLEGKGLKREHWSALSIVPGLSSARGEVSSFGMVRLAFWKDECENDEESVASSKMLDERKSSSLGTDSMTSSSSGPQNNNVSGAGHNFLPSMPSRPSTAPSSHSASNSVTPLTPFDGCIASMSPARSPFFPSFAQQNQKRNGQAVEESKPFNKQPDPFPLSNDLKKQSKQMPQQTEPATTPSFIPPHHYGKESYKSSVIHNDSNPIWGDANMLSHSSHSENGGSNFRIPLNKEDLFPSLKADGARVALEVRLDEEMARTESLLVGGALSHAVGAATAATSLVPVVGKSVSGHAQNGARAGMEMLGLGTDRMIGRGYVDLMPLLMGVWEEEFKENHHHVDMEGGDEVDEYGRLDEKAYVKKKRVDKMGLLDVWVPLRRGTNNNNENHGKVHLLISYEPNGMQPKQHDIVALESFARRPYSDNASSGPVITPIIPPLHPLLVVQTSHNHLLVEYTSSRTVTSVDRNGNVKSSKWSRANRVRIHRNSAFVIERRTLLDAVGDVARLPGDLVLSTPVGQEIADVTAPIVAASMELMGPALLWGKLLMSAGGTGVRAGMAGLKAATEAVVSTSSEHAHMARSQRYERRGEEGVYSYGG